MRVFRSVHRAYYFAVHPCASDPGRVQATKMDSDGPIGHVVFDDECSAVQSVMGTFVSGPPYGDATFKEAPAEVDLKFSCLGA